MVGRRLRGRVRTVRRVPRGFAKWRVVLSQRSVHLVGGHVKEAEAFFVFRAQTLPILFRFGEERERSVDVGADKFVRPQYGTVHVALGSEVDDGGGLMIAKDPTHESAI